MEQGQMTRGSKICLGSTTVTEGGSVVSEQSRHRNNPAAQQQTRGFRRRKTDMYNHKLQRRLLVSSTFMDQQLKSLISYIVLTLLMFFSLYCISREMGQRIKLFLDKIQGHKYVTKIGPSQRTTSFHAPLVVERNIKEKL